MRSTLCQRSGTTGVTGAFRRLVALSMTAFLGIWPTASTSADDWPQWRGLHRDGVWRETGILEKFPAGGLTIRWRAPTGTGYSSPVVAAGRAYHFDVELKKPKSRERLRCWEALTGQLLWTHDYEVNYPDWAFMPEAGAGPNSTPIVHDGKLYAWGRRGTVFCLDAIKGNVLWQKNVQAEYQLKEFAGTPSPLIEGDLLILALGGKPQAGVVGLHRNTGKEVWKSLDEDSPHSSPIVIEAGGKRQLIVWTTTSVTSLDPATGAPYWRERFIVGSGTPVSTPVFQKDRLLVAGLMLRVTSDKPAAKLLWPKSSATRILSDTSTAVLSGDHVYSAKSSGELVCLDAETGQQVWSTDRVTDPKHGAAMHITTNGDSFLIFTERGELIRARLTPVSYTELSRTALIKPTYAFGGRKVTWSLPAYANRHIFVRNDEELICASLAANER